MVEPKTVVQLDMEWPEKLREAVQAGDYLGAIDFFTVHGGRPPADLLIAAAAMLTNQSTTGHIYTVEWYLGRARIHAVAPGKVETVPTPPRKQ